MLSQRKSNNHNHNNHNHNQQSQQVEEEEEDDDIMMRTHGWPIDDEEVKLKQKDGLVVDMGCAVK